MCKINKKFNMPKLFWKYAEHLESLQEVWQTLSQHMTLMAELTSTDSTTRLVNAYTAWKMIQSGMTKMILDILFLQVNWKKKKCIFTFIIIYIKYVLYV